MASEIAIKKAAIARLGAEVPTATTDDVDEMIAANAIYTTLVEAALTKHAYSFATKYEVIDVDTTAPELPWVTRYPLPAGDLNVRDVLDQYGRKVLYEINENWIYTRREASDDPTLTLIHTWFASESRWPADFAEAVEEELLGRLLGAFEERIRSTEVRQIARNMFAECRTRDRRQNPPIKPNRAPLLRAWRNTAVERR